jgi:hypothetical protein
MTGLNSKQKVVGREQDSGETERERDRERDKEAECCWKRGMASVIKLAVVENSYDGCRRLILDHQDGHYDYFLRLKYFLCCLLLTFHLTNKSPIWHNFLLQS